MRTASMEWVSEILKASPVPGHNAPFPGKRARRFLIGISLHRATGFRGNRLPVMNQLFAHLFWTSSFPGERQRSAHTMAICPNGVAHLTQHR